MKQNSYAKEENLKEKTMFFKLLLLFMMISIIEIAILIEIGKHLGAFYTITLIIIIGILRVALAKSQDLQVYRNIKLIA